MIFACYTGSKTPVRNRLDIQLVKLDFSKLIFSELKYRSTGERVAKVLLSNLYTVIEQAAARFGSEAICDTSCHFWLMKLMPGKGLLEQSQDHNGDKLFMK